MTAAGLEAAFIPSGGSRLLGGLYRAAGDDPRPAVLLLHGLPGHEKNLDLAVDLRQISLHVLYLHYRGAWGPQGDFSCAHLVPDAAAGLEWLRRRPEARRAPHRAGRVQPGRLGRLHAGRPGTSSVAGWPKSCDREQRSDQASFASS